MIYYTKYDSINIIKAYKFNHIMQRIINTFVRKYFRDTIP